MRLITCASLMALGFLFSRCPLSAQQTEVPARYTLKPTPKTVAWGYYDAKAAPKTVASGYYDAQ